MEINKCAKCGGEAEHIKLWESKRPDCFFRCKGCGRETTVYTSKQNAIAAWNDGKLIHTDADIIELLKKRAMVGRPMMARDKLLMLEAAARIERLAEDKAELEAIVDLRNKREWYSKFVEEVYQKIPGNELSTPDFDYIYEQYFKLRDTCMEFNRKSAEDAQRALEVTLEETEKAKAETLQKVRERFALHFGTYTENDTVRVLDVFKLLSQIE